MHQTAHRAGNASARHQPSPHTPVHPRACGERRLRQRASRIGPNATLVADDVEAVMRGLKAQLVGEIQVGGPDLARSLTDLGLIDEYRLYFRPVVLGRGKPFFAGPRPPLRLVASDLIGGDAIRLTYVPA